MEKSSHHSEFFLLEAEMKRVNTTKQYTGWQYQYLGDVDPKGNPVGTKYDYRGNPSGTTYDSAGNPTFIPRWDDEYIWEWYDYIWGVPALLVILGVTLLLSLGDKKK